MKKAGIVILIFLLAAVGYGVYEQKSDFSQASLKQAKINFTNTHFDFKKISFDSKAEVKFTFKNKGAIPLILTNVKSSCGCTIPHWSNEPVKEGESGIITVKYNTKITGKFHKSITVYSNAKNSPHKLYISGLVKKNIK